MRYLKLFENFKINEHNVGDMVYVDAYGPSTYGFSEPGGEIRREIPFRPRLYNFEKDTKYEIISINGDQVTLFDEENEPRDFSSDRVFSEKIETDYIKDCIASSFEDILDINKFEYSEYINEIVANLKDEQIGCAEFDAIFHNEFKPRLESDGFNVSRLFFIIKNADSEDAIAFKLQICVRKKPD
jgi:hypothetical protein